MVIFGQEWKVVLGIEIATIRLFAAFDIVAEIRRARSWNRFRFAPTVSALSPSSTLSSSELGYSTACGSISTPNILFKSTALRTFVLSRNEPLVFDEARS
jgi:hypothetical protein